MYTTFNEFEKQMNSFIKTKPLYSKSNVVNGGIVEYAELKDLGHIFKTAFFNACSTINESLNSETTYEFDFYFLAKKNFNFDDSEDKYILHYLKMIYWQPTIPKAYLNENEIKYMNEVLPQQEKIDIFLFHLTEAFEDSISHQNHAIRTQKNLEIRELENQLELSNIFAEEQAEEYEDARNDLKLAESKIWDLKQQIKEFNNEKKKNFFKFTVLPVLIGAVVTNLDKVEDFFKWIWIW